MPLSPVHGLRGRLRSRLAAMGAAALLVAVAGCSALGGSDTPAEEGAPAAAGGLEKTDIRMGILPIADCAVMAHAFNAGYYADEGLNVELQEMPSGAAVLPLIVSGELDVGYNNWPTIMVATAQGVGEFKVFPPFSAAGQNSFVMLAKPDSAIKTPQDVAGKTVAINTFKSINEILLRSSLESNGVDPTTVSMVDMPFPEMLPALQNDQVDAIVLVEPFITQAAQAIGAVNILDVASGPTAEIPTSGGVTTAQFAAENPNTMQALRRAAERAVADLADRTRVEETLLTYTKIDAPTASLIALPVYLTSLDEIGLQRMADLMLQYGVLPESVEVAPMLDIVNVSS